MNSLALSRSYDKYKINIFEKKNHFSDFSHFHYQIVKLHSPFKPKDNHKYFGLLLIQHRSF